MSNFLSGGIEELESAKAAVQAADERKAELIEVEARAKEKKKNLENQKRYVSDKIESAIKERRSAIKKNLDGDVDSTEKRLKEIEKKKKKAKDAAVDARIRDNTSGNRDSIKLRKKENKAMFKAYKIPAFCNTGFYYALFAPRRLKDILVIIITVIITLGVIPNIVCGLLKNSSPVLRGIVYGVIVIVFVLIYLLIYLSTHSGNKKEGIERGRANIDVVAKNKKEMKKIAKGIKSDTDESQYGLQEFDEEIRLAQAELAEKEEKREAALKQFDDETARQITEEIEKENKETIEKMQQEADELNVTLCEKRSAAEQLTAEVNENFGVYLGKKNLSVERIDSLIALINEGKAETVMQAIDMLNGEIK